MREMKGVTMKRLLAATLFVFVVSVAAPAQAYPVPDKDTRWGPIGLMLERGAAGCNYSCPR